MTSYVQKNRSGRIQVETYIWGVTEARSGKTRSPLPLTRRRRLHPSDRLSPILAHQLLASMMPSVKPENHRDPVVSGYPTSLPSKRLVAKSFQIDLGDTDTGGLLLVRSDSFFSAKGNKSIQLTMRLIQFRHSLMDRKESSTRSKKPESLCKKRCKHFLLNSRSCLSHQHTFTDHHHGS